MAVLLIMASDPLEASEIRPLSLLGTLSRFSSVWSGRRLLGSGKEVGSSHEASCRLPVFPDLARHFRRPCLFHFSRRKQTHSFPCRFSHLFVLGGRNRCGCVRSWPLQFSDHRLVGKLRFGLVTQVWDYPHRRRALWLVGSQTERAPDRAWGEQVGLAFEWLVGCCPSLGKCWIESRRRHRLDLWV